MKVSIDSHLNRIINDDCLTIMKETLKMDLSEKDETVDFTYKQLNHGI
jgi:hypothetical protein